MTTPATPSSPEHNNLADALTELRILRADLARTSKPTRDLLAELAEARRTIVMIKQTRDRLDTIWGRMVSEAAAVERALICAGFERPTFRAAELIDQLAAQRDQARQLAEVKP